MMFALAWDGLSTVSGLVFCTSQGSPAAVLIWDSTRAKLHARLAQQAAQPLGLA